MHVCIAWLYKPLPCSFFIIMVLTYTSCCAQPASVVTSTSETFFRSTMTEANAVSLKLPTFWTSQPQVWVQQAEAQFTIRNITVDQTKYAYTVVALDQDTAGRLLDILRAPPAENKYEAIKTRLMRTFGLTHRVRDNRLLQMGDFGDRMPSVLMDELLALLDGLNPAYFSSSFSSTGCRMTSASSWPTPISRIPANRKSLSTLMSCGRP